MPESKSPDPDASTAGSITRPAKGRVLKPGRQEGLSTGGVRMPNPPKPVRDLTEVPIVPPASKRSSKARSGG